MRYFYLTPMLGGPGAVRYPLSERAQLIGRTEKAEIPLLEPTVSRRHATIQCDGGRVVLKDLGSKHGTFVNSKRVTNVNLKTGDIVVFGLTLVLRLEAAEQPLPAVDAERAAAPTDFLSDDIAITAIRTVTLPPTGRAPVSVEREDIGRIQNQMAKVHKLAAAGAACVHHLPELASKLTALRERLATCPGDEELDRARTLLDEAMTSLQRLNHHLSVLPRRRLELTSISEVIDSATAETFADAAARTIQVVTKVEPDLMVMAESHRLAHAVAELLRNAIRHSREGAAVRVVGQRRDGEAILAVIDSGEGFAADILETACDPFVTRCGEWEALGLGLFEARQIVSSYGGALEIESQPGNTAVRLTLPLSR